MQAAIADLGDERVAAPGRTRLGRDDIDVAVEQQRSSPTGPAETRDQLRAPGEVKPRRHERPPGERGAVGLPHVDRGAGEAQAVGEMRLERRLLARRVADRSRRRVKADEL